MIKVSDLTFGYNRKKFLFKNLNLQLKPGHIYGLLGINGSGKSTLLHILSGLLTPQSGIVHINEHVPGKREINFLQNIFLLPEEFYVPDISITRYSALFSPFYPAFDKALFQQTLNEFKIDTENNMHKMSMGQRKKAFIAFALATQTQILWMDEPTNGLDIPSKTQFRKIMASITTEDKIIVISTHQVRDLESLIDTVIVLDENQIALNEELERISSRLSFINYNNYEKPENILYDEPSFGGGKAIVTNNTGKSSRVDMELLFNAVICDKKEIVNQLNA